LGFNKKISGTQNNIKERRKRSMLKRTSIPGDSSNEKEITKKRCWWGRENVSRAKKEEPATGDSKKVQGEGGGQGGNKGTSKLKRQLKE